MRPPMEGRGNYSEIQNFSLAHPNKEFNFSIQNPSAKHRTAKYGFHIWPCGLDCSLLGGMEVEERKGD